MAYYVLEYALADDYVERRAPLREEHLGLAREAHDRGALVLGGALGEPMDRALMVWRVDDPAVVAEFAERDPYVRHGLVTAWTVRPWAVAVG
ncbi:YciI-like protein [Streptomyces huiliensis]|uniref:YciI-like protein n=1 Tax=Streptomyces huiliensis TaxID=2876027 RepID=UPI001CC0C702|nr:YciI-like protein [Streptomyces huiliensis]MBZ4323082.1 YciI family protein [Streptomyces huiliensis]